MKDCPVCRKPDLRNLSDHLRQVYLLQARGRKPWLSVVTLLCHAIALYHVTCVSQSCAFKSMCSERLTSLVSVEAVMTSLIKSLGFQLPL